MVFEHTPENDFTYLIVSSDKLTSGTYSLWNGETQLAVSAGGMGGFKGGFPGGFPGGGMLEGMEIPEGGERPELPEDMVIPEGGERPELPEGMEIPEGMERPEGGRGQGGRGGQGGFGMMGGELSKEITIVDGGNYFNNVSVAE